MARDPNATGAKDSTTNYININAKAGKFNFRGEEKGVLSGYLDKVLCTEKEALTKDDIPQRWEITLLMSIANEAGEFVQYNVNLSTHWRSPLLSNVLNALVGQINTRHWQANPDERLIVISLYQKDADSSRPKLCAFLDCDNNRTRAKQAYPYNESINKFEGVPEFEWDTPEGRKAIENFWLANAAYLAQQTGGTVTSLAGPIETLPDSMEEVQTWKPVTGGVSGSKKPVKQESAKLAESNLDKAKAWVTVKLESEAFDNGFLAKLEQLSQRMSPVESGALIAWLNAHPGCPSGFHVTGNFRLHPNSDDLPF